MDERYLRGVGARRIRRTSPERGVEHGAVPFDPKLVGLAEAGDDKPYDWALSADGLRWDSALETGGRTVVIVAPFTTDLASVPRFLSWLFPRYGKYTKAAVVHDYLCQSLAELAPGSDKLPTVAPPSEPLTLRDRSDADSTFLRMMTELDVPWARRLLMYSAVSWATVLTVLTAKRATGRVWIGRAMAALLVVAIVVALLTGAFDPFVSDDGSWAWLQIAGIVVVVTAIGSAWLMIAGVVALGRADRLLPFLGAAAFTVVSLPLIIGGLAIGVLLVIYLVLEDLPTGFKAFRTRWKLGKTPGAPRAERKEAVARAVDAAAAPPGSAAGG
jgi:hypothetical protein